MCVDLSQNIQKAVRRLKDTICEELTYSFVNLLKNSEISLSDKGREKFAETIYDCLEVDIKFHHY